MVLNLDRNEGKRGATAGAHTTTGAAGGAARHTVSWDSGEATTYACHGEAGSEDWLAALLTIYDQGLQAVCSHTARVDQ